MNEPSILIVDDELYIRRLMRSTLERAGYAIHEAENARDALDLISRRRPAAVLLDLGLPDRDGLELVQILKRASGAAVIVVSARDATDLKVAALDLGADDYVTKPFDSEELLARLRTALRHQATEAGAPPVVRTADLEIDLPRRQVRKAGEIVHLTRKEYDVLAALAAAPGRVVTHQAILERAWPFDHDRRIEYLRIVVRNLRQKVETDPVSPVLITNELGVGYRLTVDA